MLRPGKLPFYAKKNERTNLRFRTWLKIHADPEELDEMFFRLHQELFAEYDCSRCRNCCKHYCGTIPVDEVEKDAAVLGLTETEFRTKYLKEKPDADEQAYQTKNMPCDFLQENGKCLLGDHKPDSCKKYPYTDQPDRMGSLLSFLESTSVCPVAYEILERLKKEYGFTSLTPV